MLFNAALIKSVAGTASMTPRPEGPSLLLDPRVFPLSKRRRPRSLIPQSFRSRRQLLAKHRRPKERSTPPGYEPKAVRADGPSRLNDKSFPEASHEEFWQASAGDSRPRHPTDSSGLRKGGNLSIPDRQQELDRLSGSESAMQLDSSRTGDMLNDFDFDAFLNDNDNENEPFDFEGAFGGVTNAASFSDASQSDELPSNVQTGSFRANDEELVPGSRQGRELISRSQVSLFRENEANGKFKRTFVSLHGSATISEDYSDKAYVKKKLYCAMQKSIAPEAKHQNHNDYASPSHSDSRQQRKLQDYQQVQTCTSPRGIHPALFIGCTRILSTC